MKSLKPYLEEHPFFEGVGSDLVDLVVGCARNERFDVDDYIFREGEDADVFYLIRHGRVALEMDARSEPVILSSLSPGEILGWSWLLPPHPWWFNARAVELTRAVAIDCECLRKKCEENHSLGYVLLKRSASDIEKRLYRAYTQLVDVYGTGH